MADKPTTPRWVASLDEMNRWSQAERDTFFRTGRRPEHGPDDGAAVPLAPPPDDSPIRPSVTYTVTGAPIAQVVAHGVEFVADTVAHADDGERLTVTISGPVRHRDGSRAHGVAKVVAEVTRRVRGKE